MKKRIFAMAFCLILLFCCSCDTAKVSVTLPKGDKTGVIQTVISMNPSVVSSDGSVETARNVISKNMSADLNSGTAPALYENSNWQWAYSEADGGFVSRIIRALEPFKDGSGKTSKGVPYAYTVTDDRSSSLAVFDTSQMDIGGYTGDTVSQKGLLFTFTGSEKETLIYTAPYDCTVSLCDNNGGTISLIKNVSSINTDTLSGDDAKGVVMGVYLNNRLLWQEVLGNEALLGNAVTSVDFPTIENVEMLSGDAFVITAQAVTSADGIETGYFEIPEGTSLVTKEIKVANEVLVENSSDDDDKSDNSTKEDSKEDSKEEEKPGLPFVDEEGNSIYDVIRSSEATSEMSSWVNSFRNRLEEVVGTDVNYRIDTAEIIADYKILVGETSFEESKKAMAEIKKKRSNNAADFIIRVSGKNIVIAANSDVGYELAFDYFLENICKHYTSTIPLDYNYVSSEHTKLKTVKIAGNNIEGYKMIVSHVASYMEISAAELLREEIIKLTGVDVGMYTDDEAKVSAKEILIGKTNRMFANYYNEATLTAKDDYIIKVQNGKISVTGDQDFGVNAGVSDLISLLKTRDTFNNGYTKDGKYDGGYSLTDGYKLIVAEEFNGTDYSSIWRTVDSYTENAKPFGGLYTVIEENSYVENGTLVQRFHREGDNVFGARLCSYGPTPLMWQYGYAEIRVKYPTNYGSYMGFCLYGFESSSFMEMDIVETFGNPYQISHTLHQWMPHIQHGFPANYSEEPWGIKYHTIGFEWDTDTITFKIDGKTTSSFDVSSPKFNYADNPQKVQFAHVLSEKFTEDFVESFAYIDYFRLYQKADNGSQSSITQRY